MNTTVLSIAAISVIAGLALSLAMPFAHAATLDDSGFWQVSQTGMPVIPDWVREVSGFWADGMISDYTYANTLEYLINNGIITVHGITDTAQTETVRQEPPSIHDMYDRDIYACSDLELAALTYMTPDAIEMFHYKMGRGDYRFSNTYSYESRTTPSSYDGYDIKMAEIIPTAQIREDMRYGYYDHCSNLVNARHYMSTLEDMRQYRIAVGPDVETFGDYAFERDADVMMTFVTSCEAGIYSDDSVTVRGGIKNTSTKSYEIEYVVYVTDDRRDEIRTEIHDIDELEQGDTWYVDHDIRYDGDWGHCGIQIMEQSPYR